MSDTIFHSIQPTEHKRQRITINFLNILINQIMLEHTITLVAVYFLVQHNGYCSLLQNTSPNTACVVPWYIPCALQGRKAEEQRAQRLSTELGNFRHEAEKRLAEKDEEIEAIR